MSRVVGDAAEEIAVVYLEKVGYKIVERNYFARVGEIDIIAEKNEILCFIEVKDRAYSNFGGAAAAITKSKLTKIIKTAKRYLYQNNLLEVDWRVDAVLIDGKSEPQLVENIYVEGMS